MYVQSTWQININIDCDHLVELVFITFLDSSFTFSPFSYCILWKEVTIQSPHLKVKTSSPALWEQSIHVSYFEFFCMGHLSFSFICSFIKYCIYIRVKSWIFILCFGLLSNSTLFTLLLKSFQLLSLKALSFAS